MTLFKQLNKGHDIYYSSTRNFTHWKFLAENARAQHVLFSDEREVNRNVILDLFIFFKYSILKY